MAKKNAKVNATEQKPVDMSNAKTLHFKDIYSYTIGRKVVQERGLTYEKMKGSRMTMVFVNMSAKAFKDLDGAIKSKIQELDKVLTADKKYQEVKKNYWEIIKQERNARLSIVNDLLKKSA